MFSWSVWVVGVVVVDWLVLGLGWSVKYLVSPPTVQPTNSQQVLCMLSAGSKLLIAEKKQNKFG